MKDAGGHGSVAKEAPEAPEAPEAKMAPMKAQAKMAPEAPQAAMDSRVRGVLAQGHPKSAPVDVHPAMQGQSGDRYFHNQTSGAIHKGPSAPNARYKEVSSGLYNAVKAGRPYMGK